MVDRFFSTKVLAEASVTVALTVILREILPPLYTMPQGGSVTVAGLVPLLWFALRRGTAAGMFAGAVYGLINMSMGGDVVHPVQALLDYPLAFAALGLAGLWKKYPLVGVVFGIAGRFVCSFLAGIIFFTSFSIDGVVASAVYNGTYLVGELIISLAVMLMLMRANMIDVYL
ncbi:MAG TPA: energy-coupled thiamine transporter ThiT [Candidatus Bathyarchaeota archaeon]|nr:MAG: energy-coupled thiamine transporter ThiT [Candidatus Bathyarchaeota archaeon]HDI07896.1 energy-coupled thiamine transporter ThiT [Candidatus Bathyarchaeota archaeon]